MRNVNVALLFAYVFFNIGIAVAKIGTKPDVCEPFEWYLPLMVAMVMLVPAWLGYLIGKDEEA